MIGGCPRARRCIALATGRDLTGSLAILDRAASLLDPSNQFDIRNVVEALAARGQAEKARSLLKLGPKPAEEAWLLGFLAAGLAKAGDFAGAMAAAREIGELLIDEAGNKGPLATRLWVLGYVARSLLVSGAIDQAFELSGKLGGDNDVRSDLLARPAHASVARRCHRR